jgi:metal-responsive CopG/Arc/MetJ family transcriptional regulator
MICHTMAKVKVAITLEEKALRRIDRLVRRGVHANRSQAIQDAIEERLMKLDHGRLARESANLDPKEEQTIAEEGMSAEAEWPEY